MTSDNLLAVASDWQEQARECLLKENYTRAALLYEQAIEAEPNVKSYYWQLGLMLLLQGQEAEAQTTWLLGMAEGDPEEIEQWTQELVELLEVEAERQRLQRKDYGVAWAVRQHLREINPANLHNLLHLMAMSILLDAYTGEEPHSLGVIELLKSNKPLSINHELLMQLWKSVLDYAPLHPSTLELTEACLDHVQEPLIFIDTLIHFVYKIAYLGRQFPRAVKFTELGLRLDQKHPELLLTLSSFYQDVGESAKGIEMAKFAYSVMEKLADKVYACHLIIRGMMTAGGYADEAYSTFQTLKSLVADLIEQQPTDLDSSSTVRLFSSIFFYPYFQDRPQENIQIRRQIAEICQSNLPNYAKEQMEKCHQRLSSAVKTDVPKKRLKIGYLSYCLRRHSVGWLARWVFEYHDPERFEIYAYLLGSESKLTQDPLEEWYTGKVFKARKLGLQGPEVAELICEDEIDILVELDSLTLNTSCEIMMLKPAPIQVSWLGWDSPGIPNIDYFIADPYVLPESAEDYYVEKIWRLPQSYIAVDGFELDVPRVRRDQLNIPNDAVAYVSFQRGYKYNAHTVRLQMQIIKAVPNSYFLVKGLGDEESLKNFFTEIAESEGVNADRLRFLPIVATETIHRANLGIADVVLDTYPYNGATTTLETLWMGIPLVTRVGQQFSSRNSYTMMMNVGITEGIAWTEEEYVEWGIRLGKDTVLRQQISCRLRQSRHTAPLWNAQHFTREMEKAYEQMWQRYLESHD
ncbi:O-linked N-acetylglucosamine transferase family protein [Microcoleus sp. BROC3]|uniref:O-linked N-acetylglucosamine transferase family protein n=1 Tax=Microcoleus sp. BROC3 TaxID=3055323 RepID=UPI002FD1680E